jgi:hypothetical protein
MGNPGNVMKSPILAFTFGDTHVSSNPHRDAKTAAAFASMFLGVKHTSLWYHKDGTVTLDIPGHDSTTFTLAES